MFYICLLNILIYFGWFKFGVCQQEMEVIKEEPNMEAGPDPLAAVERDVFSNLIMLREPKIEEIVSDASICLFCNPFLWSHFCSFYNFNAF
jgi:hypothetical protein